MKENKKKPKTHSPLQQSCRITLSNEGKIKGPKLTHSPLQQRRLVIFKLERRTDSHPFKDPRALVILQLLRQRPHSPEELVHGLGAWKARGGEPLVIPIVEVVELHDERVGTFFEHHPSGVPRIVK